MGNKFCPSCGTQLQDNSIFCNNCGTRQESFLANNTQEVQRVESVPAKFKRKNSKAQCFKTSLLKLFFFCAMIIPIVLLPLITVLLLPKFLYVCVYIVAFLLLSLSIVMLIIKTRKSQRNIFSVLKTKLKLVVSCASILIILTSAIIFLESAPNSQLVGCVFECEPTTSSRLTLTFFVNNKVTVDFNTYKTAPWSPSGLILDESNSNDLTCKYIGKTSIQIDTETFFGSLQDDELTFPNTAEISLSDSVSSEFFRDMIWNNSFRFANRYYCDDNWDYYFRKHG